MEHTLFLAADLGHIWPELILFIGGGVVLLRDAFSQQDITKSGSYLLAQVVLVLALVASVFSPANDGSLLQGHYISDALSSISRTILLGISIFTLSYAKDFLMAHHIYKSEFYVLAIFSILGMLIMVSAQSLLTLYLGIEMLALSTYVLTAFDRESGRGSEAAMKYFILGSVASGLILYGMSMAYGATGSLDLVFIAEYSATISTDQRSLSQDLPLMLALVFLLAGILFKLGAAPFHMWVPDVYQGAPAGSVVMMSAAPKIAYLVLLIRVVMEGFGSAVNDWQPIIMVVALMSIILGNMIAIVQTEIKRLLAYSTISHVGFMLLGLSSVNADNFGPATAYFYIVTYAISAAAAMAVVIMVSHRESAHGDVPIANLGGLSKQSAPLALVLLFSMMSMAGIPILVGFFAKLGVIIAVINAGLVWLAIIAIVFAVIGAYYYLRVIKVAYFDDVEQPVPLLTMGTDTKWLLTINTVLILVIGLFPQKLITLCQSLF